MSDTLIGRSIDSGREVEIGDIERRSGLYILGNPGMGKSNLMELMIIADIQKGNGVFFLDPHGEAIDKIVKHLTRNNTASIRILDPQDEKYSFGINPLSCRDLTSLAERTDTYTRAYNIFYKIWEQDWGVWLQLIVQNTLYAFLENPEYTLADVPLFFTNENFRYHLVNNIKYNLDVKDFWQTRFESKREYAQQRQVDAALTRISILLGQPYVKHIIGQTKTTVDFPKALAECEQIFLKLSASLAPDIKKFTGTIIISELLQAVRNRPAGQRDQFCVYIDEFQNFSNSEDLATFITEARKFGIATTIAHQERHGQLSDNTKIQGATLSAANKVFFQLTVKDAEELASEFAKEPPVEIRRERELVISQEPVAELLRGHIHPFIRAFVNCYLRSLSEKREDAKEDMEKEKLIRDDLRDRAALERLYAQMEGLNRHASDYGLMQKYLQNAEYYLSMARVQTGRLITLFETAKDIRLLLRRLNKLFVEIMEGRFEPRAGNEEFSRFIAERVLDSPYIQAKHKNIFELFIQLSYGNPTIKRVIPFELARAHRLFQEKVALLTHQAEEKTSQERQEFTQKDWDSFCKRYKDDRDRAAWHQECEREVKRALIKRIINSNYIERAHFWHWRAYTYYPWLNSFPDRSNSFKPYYQAEFTKLWKSILTPSARETQSIDEIIKPYYQAEFAKPWKYLITPSSWQTQSIDELIYEIMREFDFKNKATKKLAKFLLTYQEGAFVVLSLIDVAAHGSWRYWRDTSPSHYWIWDKLDFYIENYYEKNIKLYMGSKPGL